MGDRILITGVMEKQGAIMKNWKERFFVLSFLELKYYENEAAYEQSKKPLGVVMINTVSMTPLVPSRFKRHHGITLVPKIVSDRQYFFVCNDADGHKMWIDAFGKAIGYHVAAEKKRMLSKTVTNDSFENLSHHIPLITEQVHEGIKTLYSFQSMMRRISAGLQHSAESLKKAVVVDEVVSDKDGMSHYVDFIRHTQHHFHSMYLHHERMAQDINKSITVPLKQFIGVCEDQLKAIMVENKQQDKEMAALRASLEKSKAECLKQHTQYILLLAAANDAGKSSSKLEQRKEKLQKLFIQYQVDVSAANKKLAVYYNETLPFIIARLQLVEKTRLTELESLVHAYRNIVHKETYGPTQEHLDYVDGFVGDSILYRDDQMASWIEKKLQEVGSPPATTSFCIVNDLPEIRVFGDTAPSKRTWRQSTTGVGYLSTMHSEGESSDDVLLFHETQYADQSRSQLRQQAAVDILHGAGGQLFVRRNYGNWDQLHFMLVDGELKATIQKRLRGRIEMQGAVLRSFGKKDFGRSYCFGIARKMDYRHTGAQDGKQGVTNWNVLILAASSENEKQNWLAYLSQHVKPSYSQSSLLDQVSIDHQWTLVSAFSSEQWRVIDHLTYCAALDFKSPLQICNDVQQHELSKTANALVKVGSLIGDTFLLNLIRAAIGYEVSRTEEEAQLFRVNSLASKLMTQFVETAGAQYLSLMLQECLVDIITSSETLNFEINPRNMRRRLEDQNKAVETKGLTLPPVTDEQVKKETDKGVNNLINAGKRIMEQIVGSLSYAPHSLRAVSFCLRESVQEKFPDARETLSTSGFLFLRWICPAILNAHAWAVPKSTQKTARGSRTLLLLTKMLQNLANGVMFGDKEEYMLPVNLFIEESEADFIKFCTDFCRFPYHLLSDPSLSFRQTISADDCYHHEVAKKSTTTDVKNADVSQDMDAIRELEALMDIDVDPTLMVDGDDVAEPVKKQKHLRFSSDALSEDVTPAPMEVEVMQMEEMKLDENAVVQARQKRAGTIHLRKEETFQVFPGLVVDSATSVRDRANALDPQFNILYNLFNLTS